MLTTLQRMAITAKHREDWYRVMAKTAEDGLPQMEVLQRLAKDFVKTKHPLGPLIKILVARLSGAPRPGAPALRTVGTELKGLVPDSEATLIQAGIQSGHMAAGFRNAADFLTSQGQLRKAVFAAMGKPVFYVIALLGLLLFFSVKVLPAFEKGTPRKRWPPSAQLLGAVSDNSLGIAIGFVVASLLLVALLAYVAPRWIGAKRDFADRNVFPFTLLAQLNGATLLKSVSCYIGAGFPIMEAIRQIGASSTPYMANQCQRVEMYASEGRRFEEGLVQLPIVHARYHWLINVYGLASDAAQAYTSIADEMAERTLAFVRNLFERVVSNALLIVVGGMLMWIYLSMFAIADVSSKRRTAVLELNNEVTAVVFPFSQWSV